jgi:hypothetical protein
MDVDFSATLGRNHCFSEIAAPSQAEMMNG